MTDRHLHPVPGPTSGPDDLDDLDVNAELLDQDGERPVLVDEEVVDNDAGLASPLVRRDIIPSWLQSLESLRSAAVWAVSYAWFVTAFHTVRLPMYWLRLAGRSPVGMWRLLRAVVLWAADSDSRESRDALVHSVSSDSRGADALYRLRERHREAVRIRSALIVIVGLVVSGFGLWVLATSTWWSNVVTTSCAVGVFGFAGRSADRPVTDRFASNSTAPRLTSDLIVAALSSLGLGKMNTALAKDETGIAIRFVAPITRQGPGWRADLDLPAGVTATEVIERRASLASGLRRPLGCVWPEVDPFAHEGRLILYVADRSLADSKPVAWPLERGGTTNVFEPVVIGVDQRGEPITLVLMFASGLIGSIPRMGKTFLLRLLSLTAALDKRVESHVYNLKGGPDLDAFANTAHAHRVGDDPNDIAYALNDLRAMVEDMRRRYKTVRELPREMVPESKVTDEIASNKTLGLHPVLLAVDECQIWFDHPDHGKEFVALCTDLVKRGPAVGIMAWFATQRPDAKSIPPAISDNAVLRFCLKVHSQVANDMVLGTSMYKAGYRATTLGRKDLGIALFAGDTSDPVIVRTAYVDGPGAEAITVRARAAKTAAGWLSGLAAGHDPEPDTDTASVLDHLFHVWPAGEDKVWCERLAERLAETYPGTYEAWTGEQVTASVKPHGLATTQIKRQGTNRRGITLDDLIQALGDRADPDPPDWDGPDEDELGPEDPSTEDPLTG